MGKYKLVYKVFVQCAEGLFQPLDNDGFDKNGFVVFEFHGYETRMQAINAILKSGMDECIVLEVIKLLGEKSNG